MTYKKLTDEQRIRNVMAFLSIMFGEDQHMWGAIMQLNPLYVVEKFERYVLSEINEADWGLHPALRRRTYNQWMEKHGIAPTEMNEDE